MKFTINDETNPNKYYLMERQLPESVVIATGDYHQFVTWLQEGYKQHDYKIEIK